MFILVEFALTTSCVKCHYWASISSCERVNGQKKKIQRLDVKAVMIIDNKKLNTHFTGTMCVQFPNLVKKEKIFF